ncbi:uncharacterized protein LOC107274291 isoform X2 [Cephus cinctus]|nr:uncharacterized protein LOC107274291 isoform X2 [Cephus cinctus]
MDAPSTSSSKSLCTVSEGATALVTSSSVLSVFLIALDQYFAVVDPLRYRTRIDKFKCGMLILFVWILAILFGLLATMNPHPRSIWLFCSDNNFSNQPNFSLNSSLDLTIESSIHLVNDTGDYNVASEWRITEREDIGGSRIVEEEVDLVEHSTPLPDGSFLEKFGDAQVSVLTVGGFQSSYGLIYTVVYALLAYLLPFLGVCWIYISIYSAAHKNSERARRTGSGPMLSSASFCEEYCSVRQDASASDFRRIPKISSLSSIDESIETTASQIPRRRSELVLSSTIDEEPSTVVFTVGSQKVDVTPQKSQPPEAKDTTKVPISTLRAKFLDKCAEDRPTEQLVRSKFHDRPDDRRKSSHDLMYEEMLRRDLSHLVDMRMDGSLSGNSSQDEDEDDEDDCVGDDDDDEENEYEGMLNFAKGRHLRDIEVSKCLNSVNDESTKCLRRDEKEFLRTSTMAQSTEEFSSLNERRADPDLAAHLEVQTSLFARASEPTAASKLLGTVQNSHRASKSKSQHGHLPGGRMISRLLNINHRMDSNGFEASDVEVQPARLSAGNYLEVNSSSSLLTTSAGTPMVTVTPPNKVPLHRVSSIRSTSSYINSLKYRISNGSLFKYREETRAARVSALVIVMGLICWTPYVVVLILRNLPDFAEQREMSHKYDVVALSFLILAAYVSPLLFGYRSRRVQRELRKIFCFKKELSYKNNRSLMAKKILKRRHSSNLSQLEMDTKYNIFNCVYGKNRWPKEKVQFMQVPETALAVETCRSSFSSGASTQISTTSTEES